MRQGWYLDKFFENIGRMLTVLAAEGFSYGGIQQFGSGSHAERAEPNHWCRQGLVDAKALQQILERD